AVIVPGRLVSQVRPGAGADGVAGAVLVERSLKTPRHGVTSSRRGDILRRASSAPPPAVPEQPRNGQEPDRMGPGREPETAGRRHGSLLDRPARHRTPPAPAGLSPRPQ